MLLAGALAVAGMGAFKAHEAQRTHRETAESLLRDYGTFAAWSFTNKAAGAIDKSLQSVLQPPRIGILNGPRAQSHLATLLARGQGQSDCECNGALPLAGAFAFMVHLTAEGTPSVFVGDVPAEPGAREAVVQELKRVGRSTIGRRGYGLIEAPDGEGGSRLLAWTRGTAQSDTAVYGFELSPSRVENALAEVFRDERLLPESLTRGASNDGMLAVSVALRSGHVLYAPDSQPRGLLAGQHEWPDVLGSGVVRAAVLPAVADQLIIGGLPRSRVPWLLVIFALSTGLAIVAVTYLRRETVLARQRSDFVASVSHELRTPLAQIRLFVETLRLGRTDHESQREWALATIDRETLRLTRLVENVLQFSRTDQGGTRLEPEPLSVSAEATEVVHLLRPLLRPGQAEIEVDVPVHLQVEADRDALRQVLMNLLENAAKYGPSGQRIWVRGQRRGSMVRIEVEDQGPGVPAHEREIIWESFRRGENAVGSLAVGSGIGLSVVRALVAQLGGRSHVEDGDHGGARFVIELPSSITVPAQHLDEGTTPRANEAEAHRAHASVGAA